MIENNNLEAARFQYDTTRGPSTEVHDQNVDCKNKEILELLHSKIRDSTQCILVLLFGYEVLGHNIFN